MRRVAALCAGVLSYALFALAIDWLYRPDPATSIALATCGADLTATYDPVDPEVGGGAPDVAPFYRKLAAPETVRLCGTFTGKPGLLVLPRLSGNGLVVRVDGRERFVLGAPDRPANFWVQPQLVPLDEIADGAHALEVELHGLFDVGVRLLPYTAEWNGGVLRAGVLGWLTTDIVSIAAGLNLGIGVLLTAYGLGRRRQRVEAIFFGIAALAAVAYLPDYVPSSGVLGSELFLLRRKITLVASFLFGAAVTWGLELSTRSRLRFGPWALGLALLLALGGLASPSHVAIKTVATFGAAFFLPLSVYSTFLAARFLEPRFSWLWVFFGASSVHMSWNMVGGGHLFLFHYGMLAAALGGGIRLTSQLASLARELGRATHAALTDPLTGARNRAFCETLSLAPADAVALVDFDDFKSVNDRHGHERGDRLLVDFARAARLRMRGGDHVIRLGGDEFLLVLRGAEPAAARRVIDEIFETWRETSPDLAPSASYGLIDVGELPLERALAEADRAMYVAKAHRKSERPAPATANVPEATG